MDNLDFGVFNGYMLAAPRQGVSLNGVISPQGRREHQLIASLDTTTPQLTSVHISRDFEVLCV
jgi:hypothetical protein